MIESLTRWRTKKEKTSQDQQQQYRAAMVRLALKDDLSEDEVESLITLHADVNGEADFEGTVAAIRAHRDTGQQKTKAEKVLKALAEVNVKRYVIKQREGEAAKLSEESARQASANKAIEAAREREAQLAVDLAFFLGDPGDPKALAERVKAEGESLAAKFPDANIVYVPLPRLVPPRSIAAILEQTENERWGES